MGLLVWMPLNGNLDNQGLTDIAPVNNGATVDNNGKIGKCYSFDGSDDYINLGNIGGHFDGSAFSICFWIYSLENTTRGAVFSGYGLPNTSNFFSLEINSSNSTYCNNNLRFDWQGGDTYSPANFVAYDAWVHICVTYDGVDKIKMYKNGELIQTTTRTLSAIPSGNVYYLGRDSRTGSTAFNGKLNDFRLYDHALSPREVNELAKGLAIRYTLSQGADNIYDFQSVASKWTTEGLTKEDYIDENFGNVLKVTTTNANTRIYRNVTNIWEANQKYTVSFYAKASANATCNMSRSLADFTGNFSLTTSWKKYSGVINCTSTVTNGTLTFRVVTANVAVYLTGVKLERGEKMSQWITNSAESSYSALGFNNNIEYDISGYQRNATKNNITYTTDVPKLFTGSILNGTNSYIKCNDTSWMVQKSEAMTINIWAYTADWTVNGVNAHLFSCTESGGFNIETGNSGYLRFPIRVYTNASGSAADYKYDSNGIKLSDLSSGWHMFTFTYDLTGTKIYIDGELYSQYDFVSYGIYYNTNARLFLGCEASTANPSGPYFNGRLSDFRLYYTTFTQDDVRALYNSSISQ